jgi:transcriptional regulator with XRE-family HTH domain
LSKYFEQRGKTVNESNTAATRAEEKPDVSDQDVPQLLPKLFDYFHNNREELARALGLHRSTIDRWLNGKSRPNNSTLLRMRRLAQERGIE